MKLIREQVADNFARAIVNDPRITEIEIVNGEPMGFMAQASLDVLYLTRRMRIVENDGMITYKREYDDGV